MGLQPFIAQIKCMIEVVIVGEIPQILMRIFIIGKVFG